MIRHLAPGARAFLEDVNERRLKLDLPRATERHDGGGTHPDRYTVTSFGLVAFDGVGWCTYWGAVYAEPLVQGDRPA